MFADETEMVPVTDETAMKPGSSEVSLCVAE